jgi:hypothetical protein
MSSKLTIYNLPMAVAGTEYGQAIPDFARKVLVRSRLNSSLKIAYSPEATAYITIPAGAAKELDASVCGESIYLISESNNDVAEIEVVL